MRNSNGKLETDQPSLVRSISVINDSVDWAIANSLPENTQVRIPIDLGNGFTAYTFMTFDSEPVDIGAGDDTRLVTIKTIPRRVSGRSGVFGCQYKSIFIYSPKNDQLYQSTSVFTAESGSEQLRMEEQTFLTSTTGATPRYPLVDYENRLGTFVSGTIKSEMILPPPPWVIEAMTARESLYCAGKAIVYQKTNWVFVSAFIANTTYSLMNYAWSAIAGESLITSVNKTNPAIGSRLQHIDIETISCSPNTTMKALQLQLGSTVAIESAALGARHVAIVPDPVPIPATPSPSPVAASGSNWATTAIVIGGGVGAAVAVGGSTSSGGGGSGCSGNGLVDNYTSSVSSVCMGTAIPTSDISFAIALNSDCSVTGTANVYGTALGTTPTTWSYSSGTLTIGSYSAAVLESANTFSTPLEQIFPAVAAAIRLSIPLLPPAEQTAILDNCETFDNYVSDLQMTWVR
ncbi:hypothetical protein H8D29_06150 [PVC group bacterium]|nr:hypothetical protein [PVC group bacterium]